MGKAPHDSCHTVNLDAQQQEGFGAMTTTQSHLGGSSSSGDDFVERPSETSRPILLAEPLTVFIGSISESSAGLSRRPASTLVFMNSSPPRHTPP